MRYVLRFVFVVVVVTLGWNALQRLQAARPADRQRLITLRVEASAPSPPFSVTVSEGYAVQVQWSERNAHSRFALRPIVIGGDSVRVAVEAPEDGRVVGEVVLTRGGPAQRTATSPRFDVRVVEVEER
jgi:hypothetical protein